MEGKGAIARFLSDYGAPQLTSTDPGVEVPVGGQVGSAQQQPGARVKPRSLGVCEDPRTTSVLELPELLASCIPPHAGLGDRTDPRGALPFKRLQWPQQAPRFTSPLQAEGVAGSPCP
ncbi:Adhesion G-Protein Coupled Receptor G2 [Manis pentadactyla]|nr:Adhesion G-Protein Coupled Receptor G2 [Manis pentadactyla]